MVINCLFQTVKILYNVGIDNLDTIKSLKPSDDGVTNENVPSPHQQNLVNSEEQNTTSELSNLPVLSHLILHWTIRHLHSIPQMMKLLPMCIHFYQAISLLLSVKHKLLYVSTQVSKITRYNITFMYSANDDVDDQLKNVSLSLTTNEKDSSL